MLAFSMHIELVTWVNPWPSRSGGVVRIVAVLIAVAMFTAASAHASEPSIIGGPYAVLDHGQKAGYEWRIFTSPMVRSRIQGPPCMNVTVERELRSVSEAEVLMSCGTVKPFPTITQVAVGTGKRKITVAGMAFDREVRRVKIPLSDGRRVWRSPRLINAKTARRAHVEPFAFLAFAVAQGLSIGRVIGYDASGQLISGVCCRRSG